jgi:hypothetical protein
LASILHAQQPFVHAYILIYFFFITLCVDPTETRLKSNASSASVHSLKTKDTSGQVDNIPNNKIDPDYFINLLSSETLERARVNTFSNWPSITPSPQDMINAGWWYTNIADRVICIHCNVMFHHWKDDDRPYDIHRLKSPNCLFVNMPTNNICDKKEELLMINANIPKLSNLPVFVGAVHAAYAVVCRRHETFKALPESNRSLLPSVESFVDAGFFFTGSINRICID